MDPDVAVDQGYSSDEDMEAKPYRLRKPGRWQEGDMYGKVIKGMLHGNTETTFDLQWFQDMPLIWSKHDIKKT